MLRCISSQRRATKVWIGGDKVFRLCIHIGKVTASTTGNANFFRQFGRVIYDTNRTTALRGLNGTHHPRSTGTDDDYIKSIATHDNKDRSEIV